MNETYPIKFIDFLKLFLFDDNNVTYYTSAHDFLLNTKQRNINIGTKNYNLFFENAKKLFDFEPSGFNEMRYLITHNLKKPPKCKNCEALTSFINFNQGYRLFCSQRCQMDYNNSFKEPNEQTCR